jgi:hypothetical protein
MADMDVDVENTTADNGKKTAKGSKDDGKQRFEVKKVRRGNRVHLV